MRKVSAEDLLKIIAKGASIAGVPEPVVDLIDGDDDGCIAGQIGALVHQQATHNAKLVEAIDKLSYTIRNMEQGDNAEIIKGLSVLIASIQQPVERPAYHFEVERSQRGLISNIVAKPVCKMLN